MVCTPLPTLIQGRAVFMCAAGTTYTCPLHDLRVTLPDLFHPLPISLGMREQLVEDIMEAKHDHENR